MYEELGSQHPIPCAHQPEVSSEEQALLEGTDDSLAAQNNAHIFQLGCKEHPALCAL